MTTKEAIISRLSTIASNLENFDQLKTVINNINLSLVAILNDAIPVDSDVIAALDVVRNRLADAVGSVYTRIQGKTTSLTAQRATLIASRAGLTGQPLVNLNIRIWEIERDLTELIDLETERVHRRNEYAQIHAAANNLDTTPVGAVNTLAIPAGGAVAGNFSTNFDVVGAGTRNYELVMRDGTVLRPNGAGQYTYVHNGVSHTLTGLTFNRATGQLHVAGFAINPPNPEFSALDIAIRGITQIHGLHLFRDKNVTITFPSVSLANPWARQPVLCAYNTAGGGVLQRILEQTYDLEHETMEREAIFAVLRKNDSSNKLDSLTPEQQNEAYRVLRGLYHAAYGFLPRAVLTNYPSFEGWFVANDHPGSRLPHNRNATSYTDYIHANHPQEIQRYMRRRYEGDFNDLAHYTFLKSNFLDFLTALRERQQDSLVDRTLDARNLPRMQNHRRFRAFGRDIFGRRDVNYLRFFSGLTTSLQNESIRLNNSNGASETVTYGMELRVESAQRMSITITGSNIRGNVPLTLSAGDPAALVRKVLQNTTIPYGKQRVHIAYNIVRSLITLAQDKGIPLQYLVPGTNNQINRLELQGNNVVLANSNVNVGTRREHVTTLFDFGQHFGASQNWETGGTSLESGIFNMMNHFNCAMEQTHQQYRNAITTRCLGAGDKLNTRVNLSWWKNPLKSLWNIRNKRTFEINDQQVIRGKQVTIAFKNNTFSIGLEGYAKPFEWTSLPSILNRRVNGRRVFDGRELEVLALVNRNLLTVMRQNTKIERSLVASRDPITGRLYFVEPTRDGRLSFSFVDAYDTRRTGLAPYNYDREMSRARMGKRVVNAAGAGALGFGAGTLWVGALAAGVGVSGAVKWAGAAAGGVGFFNRMRRVFQRSSGRLPGSSGRLQNYGIIHNRDNTAAGRQHCSPREEEAILRNPVVMGRFYKAMKDRMGGYEQFRAILANAA